MFIVPGPYTLRVFLPLCVLSPFLWKDTETRSSLLGEGSNVLHFSCMSEICILLDVQDVMSPSSLGIWSIWMRIPSLPPLLFLRLFRFHFLPVFAPITFDVSALVFAVR